YAFRLRTGLIRLQMPQYKWDSFRAEQRSEPFGFAQDKLRGAQTKTAVEAQLPKNPPWNPQTALAEADRLLSGEIKYFAHEFHQVGFPPNWHKIPSTLPTPSAASDLSFSAAEDGGLSRWTAQHWSQISDDAEVDIKFIWEPNRFAFVYTLVRAYAATHDEKYPKAFWTLIEDWAKHNPPNTGANWMDGQEIALRLMAWTFGFSQFSNSPSSTPERTAKFTHYAAAQAERIYKNIGYAISTRSNHTISEAFGLWLAGLLFPELKDADTYLSVGRKLLEQEAVRQIFPDGSYSMYALNYHRFILHIYLYAIRLGEINQSLFSAQLINSVTKSIEYLSHLIDPQTGQMPAYGSNDGALVLPLNNCDFTDYRPLLQLGWYITKKEFLFEPGEWDEDIFWLCGVSRAERSASAVEAPESKTSFPDGGVYILHNTNSNALIRCTDFRARPSHADQLHVDLWIRGQNIAVDAGTYLYSGEGMWRNGLAYTSVHNTVTVDGKDQMTMVSRFTWTNWSQGKVLKHEKDLWQGEHDGYKPVSHIRTVLALEEDRWLVIDKLNAGETHHYALNWLLNDFPFEERDDSILLSLDGMKYIVQVGLADGSGDFSLVRADPNSTRGWRSRYYGHKEPAISLMLEADLPKVTFWSFFGFEHDQPVLQGRVLKFGSTEIDLNQDR
ncbi:MAG TPA: alginate lyase family protein, partial [Anaerolineales bacterium]|nr:alginate lyase family protein [Anaerolineales bacterium]